MAKSNGNILLDGLNGQLGKQVVIKQYKYGTVVSRYPDMSKVKQTKKQLETVAKFKNAQVYAKRIIKDPILKAAWQAKLPEGAVVYREMIKQYMAGNAS